MSNEKYNTLFENQQRIINQINELKEDSLKIELIEIKKELKETKENNKLLLEKIQEISNKI